jgi:hypothetical protein
LVQQNRFSHCTPTENQTVQFGKPEHPVFSETQIFLDLLRNLILAVPNYSPLYFYPWKHATL